MDKYLAIGNVNYQYLHEGKICNDLEVEGYIESCPDNANAVFMPPFVDYLYVKIWDLIDLPASNIVSMCSGGYPDNFAEVNCECTDKTVIFPIKRKVPLTFTDKYDGSTVVYLKEIEDINKQDVSQEGLHVVFGDDVENVGMINGGHITLGKGVTSVAKLKKAATRIDFSSPNPPDIATISPGAMKLTELHVPVGSLDAYKSHPKWGKAANIVEEEVACTLDIDVEKFVADSNQQLDNALKEFAFEKEKIKKAKALAQEAHRLMAAEKLAPFNADTELRAGDIHVSLWVGPLRYKFTVSCNSVLEVWDRLAAKFEAAQAKIDAINA